MATFQVVIFVEMVFLVEICRWEDIVFQE